tara:strand:+ start:835 stop:990 length:156 start_codon:yes stop_codon:yes gene_type:complete
MGKIMLNFLDQLKAFVIDTKAKLKEPVTATRSKIISVGIGLIILLTVAYIL